MSEFPVCNITTTQAEQARDWIDEKLQTCTNNGERPGKTINVEVVVDKVILGGDITTTRGRGGIAGSKTDIRQVFITSYNQWNNLSEQEQINRIQQTIAKVVNEARTKPPYKGDDAKGNAKTVPVFLIIRCGRDTVMSPTTGVGNP